MSNPKDDRAKNLFETTGGLEVCKLLHAWILTSYYVLDQEIYPLLNQLRAVLEFTDSRDQEKLLSIVFGPFIPSLEVLVMKISALMKCHHDILVGPLNLPSMHPKQGSGDQEGESDG